MPFVISERKRKFISENEILVSTPLNTDHRDDEAFFSKKKKIFHSDDDDNEMLCDDNVNDGKHTVVGELFSSINGEQQCHDVNQQYSEGKLEHSLSKNCFDMSLPSPLTLEPCIVIEEKEEKSRVPTSVQIPIHCNKICTADASPTTNRIRCYCDPYRLNAIIPYDSDVY